MEALLHAFWFFLPAGIANMSPVFANKLPVIRSWDARIDFGKSWRGKRLLGDNKRWRGVIAGTVAAAITGAIIYNMPGASVSKGVFIAGSAAMGLGALLGDAAESFFKRRSGVAPGDSWFPFDQLDYIAGGLLLSYPFLRPSAETTCLVALLYFGLHILASYIGYLLGLKDKPV